MRAALQAKAPVVAEPKSAAPAVQEINVEEESEPSPRSMRSRVAGAGRVLYNLPGGVAGAVAQSPRQVGRLANRGRQEVSERTQKATNAVREGLAQLGRRSLSPRNWVRPAASILPNNGSPQRVVRGGEGRAASAPRGRRLGSGNTGADVSDVLNRLEMNGESEQSNTLPDTSSSMDASYGS
eukprot:3931909-Rhodomonas_salina.1